MPRIKTAGSAANKYSTASSRVNSGNIQLDTYRIDKWGGLSTASRDEASASNELADMQGCHITEFGEIVQRPGLIQTSHDTGNVAIKLASFEWDEGWPANRLKAGPTTTAAR